MQTHIFIGLLGIPLIMCELGTWMRYTGYYLTGHTRKEEIAVQTVENCWEACLRETGFKCLSVAYAAVGNQSCRLYDKKALSVYRDWIRSAEFSYYEYCVNGTWTWSVYKDTAVRGQNIVKLTNVDLQHCLEHCRSLPACGAVDFQPLNRLCYMNHVIGLEQAVLVWDDVTVTESDVYIRCDQVTYDYLFRRQSLGMEMDLTIVRYDYGILDINRDAKVAVMKVRYRNQCPLLCLAESRCLGYRMSNAPGVGATVCEYILDY